jgi:S1-C subfamily serine protease
LPIYAFEQSGKNSKHKGVPDLFNEQPKQASWWGYPEATGVGVLTFPGALKSLEYRKPVDARSIAFSRPFPPHREVPTMPSPALPIPALFLMLLAATSAVVAQEGIAPRSTAYTSDEEINIRVYESANRSVVNIRTEFDGIDRFFRPVSGEGSGSGWVYDRVGHIVTNYHVIEDSDRIKVTLFDGETAAASVVGVDPQNDIAVLSIQVSAESLFPLQLGDSSTLKVGQKALAIGNPFGLERTLTAGIVSSLNRTLESKARPGRLINSVIQIDAALNQGNSGGPLFDNAALLVGMNTAIASAGGDIAAQNSGVGFAIPVNTIKRVVPELIRNGKVIRASAGIYSVMETGRGLMIVLLEPRGPADQAGLRGAVSAVFRQYRGQLVLAGFRQNDTPGDLIQSIDGVEVDAWDTMQDEIEKHKPGDVVPFTVIRGRRTVTVNVRLVEE